MRKNKDILKSYGVKKIGLFGSYVLGTETDKSDIDILVELEKENIYKNYCNVKYFLEDLFNKEIDLITLGDYESQYMTKLAKDNHQK